MANECLHKIISTNSNIDLYQIDVVIITIVYGKYLENQSDIFAGIHIFESQVP